jgi:hypothetical protein
MGSDNGAAFGASLVTDLFDVRANDGQGGGIAMILNAGSSMAGKKWSILISAQAPDYGRGPLMGLGWDALNNWVALYNDPFLSGTLDADGSGRFDYPSGLVPAGSRLRHDVHPSERRRSGLARRCRRRSFS